jgi:hypothetical protein
MFFSRSNSGNDFLKGEAAIALYKYGGVRGVMFSLTDEGWRTYKMDRSCNVVPGSTRITQSHNAASGLRIACLEYPELHTLEAKQLILAVMLDCLSEVMDRNERKTC